MRPLLKLRTLLIFGIVTETIAIQRSRYSCIYLNYSSKMKIRLTHKRGKVLRPGKFGTDLSRFKLISLKLKQRIEFKLLFFLTNDIIYELLRVHVNPSKELNSGKWVIIKIR